jgi:hypothetical protein
MPAIRRTELKVVGEEKDALTIYNNRRNNSGNKCIRDCESRVGNPSAF